MMPRPSVMPLFATTLVVMASTGLAARAETDNGTGSIQGVVSVSTAQEPKRPPRYYLRARRSARQEAKSTAAAENVVVYATSAAGTEAVPPSERPQMAQRFESFQPHVLPVLAGTTIEFPNEDDFYHNVFSVVAGDRFDLGRFGSGKNASQKFDKAGVVVRCEIHSGMKAYILVLDTPYFATPDSTGRFQLNNLPAGSYTLRAWHPVAGEVSRPIEVPDGGVAQAILPF